MSERDLEPLPPDVIALLDQERLRPLPPADERLRVLARVEATLGLVGAGGQGGGSPTGADGGGGGNAPANPMTSVAPGGVVPAPIGFLARPMVIGLLGFVLGAFAGALTYARFRPLPPPVVITEAAPPVVSPTTDTPAPVAPAPPAIDEPTGSAQAATSARAAQPSMASATAAASSSAEPPGKDVDLAAERALLEIARTAIARGQSARALEALQRHASQFPRGRLAEEREALSIQALMAAGRHDDARARAERFRKTFPRSLLAPAVDPALSPRSGAHRD